MLLFFYNDLYEMFIYLETIVYCSIIGVDTLDYDTFEEPFEPDIDGEEEEEE